VQELVKLHGGEIWVVSEIGKGSTFCASIPFGVAHLPPRSVVAAPSMLTPAVRTQAYVGEAPNWSFEATVLADGVTHLAAEDLHLTTIVGAQQQLILIVDDNADMRHYIHRLLRSSGFQVKTAEDGEAGLEVARRFKPDLIISDVMMPKLDGFELVARLRQDPRLQEIPVLLLSARAAKRKSCRVFASGADDYLIKPFSARELLARVEGNLLLAKARGETARLLKEEAKSLELLHRASVAIAAELDLERVVQLATDAATEIAGGAFGSFFYQQVDDGSDNKAMRSETFSKRPMPRDPILLAPTFGGETIVRSADIAEDPRFGFRRPADRGRQIRSYLAAAVISRSGDIIGGLCVGHAETAVFNERSERLVASIANLAAIAIDKARLYQEAQHEIEERKRTEAALRESELTLEIKVAERTAQLLAANDHLLAEAAERERAEQALRHAQKLEGIGHLTGGVAHDFNNLLTVIIGNLEVLQRHLQDAAPDIARLARSTDNAIRGAKRAETLTQRLLAFARQQPLDPKPVDVGRLVSGMSDLLHRTIGDRLP
jgi:CheY-like chemotaxis protein